MKEGNILNILPGISKLPTSKKLTTTHFYIAAINKAEPSKKINSLFYSSVKTSSVKHGIAKVSVALREYVSLLTTQ